MAGIIIVSLVVSVTLAIVVVSVKMQAAEAVAAARIQAGTLEEELDQIRCVLGSCKAMAAVQAHELHARQRLIEAMKQEIVDLQAESENDE